MKDNKVLKLIKDKFIHLILIIQVIIFVASASYYGISNNIDLGDNIIIALAILFTIIPFIIEIHNYRKKDIIYRFNVILLVFSIFMICNIYFSQDNSLLILLLISLVQLFLFLFALDFALEKYSSKIIRIAKIIVGVYMTAMAISLWINQRIFLILYQSLFFLLLILPIIILLFNRRILNKYGKEIKNNYIVFAVLSFLLLIEILVVEMFRSFHVKNFDYYIYISITITFLTKIIFRSLHININNFFNIISNTFNKYLATLILLLGFGFYIIGIYSLFTNYLFFIFIILSFECYIFQYKNHTTGLIFNGDYEDSSVLSQGLIQLKREQEEKEKIAAYLHEEILQDAIYIKNQLKQKYKLSNDSEIVEMANTIIHSIRSEIDTLFPNIIPDISLKENYYNIIRTLQIKYRDKGIVIDFYCDDKLFLISPYDVIIYRMIKELVTNIYKHSDGELGTVHLSVKDDTIYLIVTNDGVPIDFEQLKDTTSRGIKTIFRDVKQLGGNIKVQNATSQVAIIIEIPIKGENTYETFINR